MEKSELSNLTAEPAKMKGEKKWKAVWSLSLIQ